MRHILKVSLFIAGFRAFSKLFRIGTLKNAMASLVLSFGLFYEFRVEYLSIW